MCLISKSGTFRNLHAFGHVSIKNNAHEIINGEENG